jgi:very-short-patch-repair endonuclease
VDTGFPRPRTQVRVPGPLGASLFIDLGYAAYRVGVEYDGERHHMTRRDREHDESRRRWLREELGWELVLVTRGDVLAAPYPFLAALMTALFERGWSPDDEELTEICTRLDRLKRRRRQS